MRIAIVGRPANAALVAAAALAAAAGARVAWRDPKHFKSGSGQTVLDFNAAVIDPKVENAAQYADALRAKDIPVFACEDEREREAALRAFLGIPEPANEVSGGDAGGGAGDNEPPIESLPYNTLVKIAKEAGLEVRRHASKPEVVAALRDAAKSEPALVTVFFAALVDASKKSDAGESGDSSENDSSNPSDAGQSGAA
jgi:nicotinamidase-related amidase